MTPWEFWDITPADLRIMQEADRERVQFQRLLSAEQATWQTVSVSRGAWGGGLPTVYDFVPDMMPSRIRAEREEKKAAVQRMKARQLFAKLGISAKPEQEH